MKSHRDHGAYVEYNLEAVAEMLATKFENSHILIIRPAKVELKTFSCYANFVACNHIGTPFHEPNHNALLHLTTLLMSVSEQTEHLEIGWDSTLTIIGFSKGCVVLNQFLHEFHYFHHLPLDKESHISALLKRIKKIMWLDGGHSGGKDTWVTSSAILSALVEKGTPCLSHSKYLFMLFSSHFLDVTVDIHVTPYQVNDDRRPWIGKEEKQFQSSLKKLGVTLFRKLYFADEPPSLENHFRLLKVFV